MYKLNNMLAFKNIPVSSNYWNSPNYDSDSYDILQIKAAHRNEFLIPLKADGDGTGVATIYLQSTESQAINITGSGRFYTDAQGTTGESTSAVVGTSLTTLYVKLNAGSCYLVLTKADKLSRLGSSAADNITEAANAPFIDGCNIGYELHNLISIRLPSASKSFFTGSIDNCPGLSYINIRYNKLCSLTGSIDNCTSLSYIAINGTPLIVFTGDIGKAILCNFFNFDGNGSPLTYVTRRSSRSSWTSSLRLIHISSASMTTEMVDNLFIDIDASGVPASLEKSINVSGLCGAVSDASLAARNSLVEKGYTLVYNNA